MAKERKSHTKQLTFTCEFSSKIQAQTLLSNFIVWMVIFLMAHLLWWWVRHWRHSHIGRGFLLNVCNDDKPFSISMKHFATETTSCTRGYVEQIIGQFATLAAARRLLEWLCILERSKRTSTSIQRCFRKDQCENRLRIHQFALPLGKGKSRRFSCWVS